MVTVDDLLTRLEDPRPNSRGWLAKCPAHDDERPSLSLSSRPDGSALVNCFGGCSFDAILGALNVRPLRRLSRAPTRHTRRRHA